MKKGRVSFRRGLSILLSVLMILCTVPLVSFAEDITDVVPVLEKSGENVFLYKTINPTYQEPFTVGQRLGDCEIVKTGVYLKVVNPETGKVTNYLASRSSVEFVNKEDSVKIAGTNAEDVIIYVTNDPSIWVKISYEFEAVQGSGIPQAEIKTMPVIEAVKYQENLTASDLTLTGGEANVPGAFKVTNPEQKLGYVGEHSISVTFTPEDLTAAEPVEMTIQATVDKGDIVIKTAPTVTLTCGQTLRNDGNRAFVGGVTEPANATFRWCDLNGSYPDYMTKGYAPGTYTLDARVEAGSNYTARMVPIQVTYVPVTAPLRIIQWNNKDGVVTLSAENTQSGGLTGGSGTFLWKANGEVIATIEGKGNAQFEWVAPASGSYELTVEYIPTGENDSYAYTMGKQTIEVVLPHALTVTGGSGSGSYEPGETVSVSFDVTTLKKNYEFKGWKVTNANGDTLDVGADLSQTNISFTMPDEAVNVEATSSFSIQLFFSNLGQSILDFFMKIAEFFSGLFDGTGSLS